MLILLWENLRQLKSKTEEKTQKTNKKKIEEKKKKEILERRTVQVQKDTLRRRPQQGGVGGEAVMQNFKGQSCRIPQGRWGCCRRDGFTYFVVLILLFGLGFLFLSFFLLSLFSFSIIVGYCFGLLFFSEAQIYSKFSLRSFCSSVSWWKRNQTDFSETSLLFSHFLNYIYSDFSQTIPLPILLHPQDMKNNKKGKS